MGFFSATRRPGGGAATASQDIYTEQVTGNSSNEATFSVSVPEDDKLVELYVGGQLITFASGGWTSGGGATVTFVAPPAGPDIDGRKVFLKKLI